MNNSIWKTEHMVTYLDENIDTDKIHIYQCLNSTNDLAKEMAKNGAPHGTVIIAQSQNAGRGRFNRQFFSPANTGLYISFVLDAKDMGISDVGLLTPLAAVVTARVIDEITSKKCGIKWVNDLYFEDKKVCGILTEGVIDKNGLQRFVLGIGINIVANSFPDDIQNIAGALFNGDKIEEDKVFDVRNHIATELINIFTKENIFENTDEYMKEYKDRQIIKGQVVTVIQVNETYDALVLDVNDKGHLIVERVSRDCEDKITTEILLSGEVSIKRN